MDLLTELTALPNLHPALVHFPIALLPMAALFELALLLAPGQRGWLERAAAVLYAAAGLGAGAAFWAGEEAADGLGLLAIDVQDRVNEHSDAAHQLVWVIGVLVVARLVLAYLDREVKRVALRGAFFVAAAIAVAMLFRAADLGGGLVYRDGVAVAAAAGAAEQPPEPATTVGEETGAPTGSPADRLVKGADGSLTWTPASGDGAALGTLLRSAAGAGLAVVSAPTAAGAAPGLVLTVEGSTLLVLPGSFGDVQIEAELEPLDFQGTLGLAHHVRALDAAGLLTLALPGGETRLVSLDGESTRQLARSVEQLPGGRLRLTVSAVGRHLRGLLGGKLVVHGHEPPLPDGSCGLYLDGRGEVRIHSLKLTPAAH